MIIFKKGFTLIELMVVMTVIAILATIALFGFGKAQASARDASRQQIMNGYRTALERYYGDNQYYPVPVAATVWTSLNTSLAGYIPAAAALDPCKGGTAIPANGIMASTSCAPAAYSYAATLSDGNACAAGTCTKYTLTLTKESGGTSLFVSPQ